MQDTFVLLHYYLKAKRQKTSATRLELEQWQNDQVLELLKFVLPKSPYTRERFSGHSPNEWRQLPIITKTDMMNHFTGLNTRNISMESAMELAVRSEDTRDFTPQIDDVTIGLSSGTSGNRGLFLVSHKERAMWAGTMLAKLLPGSLLSRHRVAFFLRANSNLYSSVERLRIQFHFFDLFQPLEGHICMLQSFSPTVLVAPPSVLRYLAQAMEAGRLHLQPQKIVSVAEVLEPIDKSYLETVFNLRIDQVYQCTEGFLGATCSRGVLHINEDVVVVERDYIDEHRFVPIITDFSRFTQPIIRYRLNDVLVERTEPCACGSIHFPVESIEGRSDDIFYFRGLEDNRMVPVFPDFIRKAIILSSIDIQEYRAIQLAPDLLSISLKVRGKLPVEAVTASIRQLALAVGCQMPKLQFMDYDWETGPVKLRRIEQRMNLHESI